jgi:aminoglycoside 6'-N-acetyltransferase
MQFEFRPITRDDYPLLARWLAAPHVEQWWNLRSDPDSIEDDFGDVIDGEEPAQDSIAVLDGEPIGLVQYCRFVDYPEYMEEMAAVSPVGHGAVTIDYFIGDLDRVGRGVGTAMIIAFVQRVWATDPYATHIVVAVNSDNVGSWKALLNAGFRLVARGEMEPDAPGHDRMHEVLRLDRPAA